MPVTADGCWLERGEVWSPWDSSQLSLLRLQQAQRVCVWAGGPASLHSQTHCCLEPGVRPRAEGVPLRPPNRTSDCTLHHSSGPLPAFPVLPTGLAATAWHLCKAHVWRSLSFLLLCPQTTTGRACASGTVSFRTCVLLPISATSSLEVCGKGVGKCVTMPLVPGVRGILNYPAVHTQPFIISFQVLSSYSSHEGSLFPQLWGPSLPRWACHFLDFSSSHYSVTSVGLKQLWFCRCTSLFSWLWGSDTFVLFQVEA